MTRMRAKIISGLGTPRRCQCWRCYQKRSCRRHAVPRVTEQVSLTFGEFTVAREERLDSRVQGYCGEKKCPGTNRCGEKFAYVAREKAVKLLDRGTGVISFTPVAREVWRYRWRLTRGHYDSFFTASRRVLKRRLLHEYNESNDASANYLRLFVILGL